MSDPKAEDDAATLRNDEPPARRAWEQPLLQRLSLSEAEHNVGVGADGAVESNLS